MFEESARYHRQRNDPSFCVECESSTNYFSHSFSKYYKEIKINRETPPIYSTKNLSNNLTAICAKCFTFHPLLSSHVYTHNKTFFYESHLLITKIKFMIQHYSIESNQIRGKNCVENFPLEHHSTVFALLAPTLNITQHTHTRVIWNVQTF